MNSILKIGLIILIWISISIKTNAQIFAYDGRSENPTIKISKNVVYKKGRLVGKIKSDTIYDYYDYQYEKAVLVKENEVYFLNEDDDGVDVKVDFAYILSDNKLYFSRDTTDYTYITIKDEFLYWGPTTKNKKILKIKGEYNFIQLIATLYFLEKI